MQAVNKRGLLKSVKEASELLVLSWSCDKILSQPSVLVLPADSRHFVWPVEHLQHQGA